MTEINPNNHTTQGTAGDTDYTILLAGDASTLSSLVNHLIRRGWQPQGGVGVSIHGSEEETTELWAQALIKREVAVAAEQAVAIEQLPRVATDGEAGERIEQARARVRLALRSAGDDGLDFAAIDGICQLLTLALRDLDALAQSFATVSEEREVEPEAAHTGVRRTPARTHSIALRPRTRLMRAPLTGKGAH